MTPSSLFCSTVPTVSLGLESSGVVQYYCTAAVLQYSTGVGKMRGRGTAALYYPVGIFHAALHYTMYTTLHYTTLQCSVVQKYRSYSNMVGIAVVQYLSNTALGAPTLCAVSN